MADPTPALAKLLELMARLRDPQRGCPWDREQTFATIAPYTIEEAYEVADAIARNDTHDLRDELGDLLFQVVFHARMAQEQGWFDFNDVAAAIHDKLVRRHPHVFGDTVFESRAAQTANWEEHKARERAAAAARRGTTASSVLGDVPQALPALMRAAKLGKRAARTGFDWPDASGVREKLNEELAELDAEIARREAGDAASEPHAKIAEELGDALFTLVNLGRHLHVDAEEALRAANRKFEARFRHMESLARARGLELDALTPGEWDALWMESKAAVPAV
ncbi:MAG TPA: nucleoside triphosphate pyrophosphohydrolase [Steroidobacteraceae bacterium]|nr:nucleoside triphosphate pyrophosphohydrolase [Steroidobacteraceae bacterium]